MRALELNNLAMAYGRRALFAGLSARVEAGETLVVTGSNGSGKSTLLKIVAGLLRPDNGSVRLECADGAVIADPAARTRYGGYAAPDTQLYPELTGDENLAFFRTLRGLPAGGEDGSLRDVGLPRARGQDRVGTYSSGMRQRLKLAVSLLGEPPVLIWDEPTGTLDAAGGQRVEDLLAAHRRRGGIAVIATNDPGEAERWAHRRVQVGR